MTSLDTLTKNGAAFDFATMDAVYVSPTYLRAPIRDYLYSFEKGIYWLRAPSQIGKTLFVRGITAKRPGKDEGIDSNIASGIRPVAVHLHKDISNPRQFVEALQAAFEEEFKLEEGERATAAANIRYGDAAEAHADFVAWMRKLKEVAVAKGAARLMVAVDGLEQASPSGEGYTIIDLLPAAAEIPDSFLLLLTSRPAEAWPAGLFEQAAAKFGSGFGVASRDITLEDDAYVKMLRTFFWDKVRPMFRTRAMTHLEQLLDNKAKLSNDKDSRLAQDITFRDALKGDWKKLTNKHPRYSMNQLPVGDLKQTLDEIEKLWTETMERADRRWGFVSYVLGRVVDGSLTLDQVAALPKADAMLGSP